MPLRRAPTARTGALEGAWACPTCGATVTTGYCGSCGERRVAAAGRVAAPTRSFVERLLASLRALASPPGRLTADWLRGRRVGYVAPLALFLWSNVAFFLVQSTTKVGILTWPLRAHLSDDLIGWFTNWLLAQHRPDVVASRAAYADLFNALESVHAKSLVIVMVPAFAAALGTLLLDRPARFKQALPFALHFFAFALLWLCALFPMIPLLIRLLIASRIALPSAHGLDLAVTALEVSVLAWYLYVALDTVFGLSRPRRLLSVPVLVAALYVILEAYHAIVFAATLYST